MGMPCARIPEPLRGVRHRVGWFTRACPEEPQATKGPCTPTKLLIASSQNEANKAWEAVL